MRKIRFPLTNQPADLLLMCCPILVFLFGEFFLSLFAQSRIYHSFPPAPLSPNILEVLIIHEAALRLLLLASFLLMLIVCFGAILWSLSEMLSPLFSKEGKRLLLSGLGTTMLILVCVLPLQLADNSRVVSILGDVNFENAVNLLRSDGKPDESEWTMSTIWWLILVARVVSGVAISCTLVLTVSCVAGGTYENISKPDASSARSMWRSDFDLLVLQRSRLNLCLNVGALLLVSVVLFVVAFSSWPKFLFTLNTESRAYAAQYSRLANSYVLFIGLEFTLYLAAIFLPVWKTLSDKMDILLASGMESEFREEVGLLSTQAGPTFAGMISRQSLAILAPVLLSLLSSVPQLISSFLSS
jgi:hypothetical protein